MRIITWGISPVTNTFNLEYAGNDEDIHAAMRTAFSAIGNSANAFLQGGAEQESPYTWTFIEFWTDNGDAIEAFVDKVNSLILSIRKYKGPIANYKEIM